MVVGSLSLSVVCFWVLKSRMVLSAPGTYVRRGEHTFRGSFTLFLKTFTTFASDIFYICINACCHPHKSYKESALTKGSLGAEYWEQYSAGKLSTSELLKECAYVHGSLVTVTCQFFPMSLSCISIFSKDINGCKQYKYM